MYFLRATLVATLTTLTYAQSISDLVQQIPTCALTCLATGSAAGGCSLTDFACQCGPAKDAISSSASPCIVNACSGDQALEVLSLTNQICALAVKALVPTITTIPTSPPPATPAALLPPVVGTPLGDGFPPLPAVGSYVPAVSFISNIPGVVKQQATQTPIPTTTEVPLNFKAKANGAEKNHAGVGILGAGLLAFLVI